MASWDLRIAAVFAVICYCRTSVPVAALNYDECVAPLGMESELIADDQIKASSSYDDASVGPHNARVGHEDGGGAWCPRQQVKKEVYEYLEIDLLQLHVISSVETQGRFGNGQGQEYAEHFMLEYQREPDSEWITFRNRTGKKHFRGNTNTYVRNTQKVDPPIIARRVRFVPHSVFARTVCMRVEVFGCPWKDGIVWYSMPQGESKAPEVPLYDWSYDGRVESNHLYLGMGQLTDGRVGADNFRLPVDAATGTAGHKTYDWVGWKNDSQRGNQIDLTFKFDVPRKFSAIYLYCNNLFTKDVQVFATASVYFSIGGKYYTGAPVHYIYTADTVMEKARNVSIKLNQHVGRYVKVILTFASRWMMISEVSFDSEPLPGNFTPEASPPELLTKSTTSSAALDGQFFHIFHPSGFLVNARDVPEVHGHKTHLYAVANTSQPTTDDYVGLIIGIVSGMVILLLIGLGIVLLRFRHRKHHYRSKFHSAADFFSLEKNLPFDLKNVQVETLRSINGNLYGSVASEEPDKNTIYHEPHEVMLKRFLPDMPPSDLIKEYHNTLCSREYAIPELKSPYLKAKTFAGNNRLPCYNQFSLQGPSGTNAIDSPTSPVQPTMCSVAELPRSCLKFIERIGEGQFEEVHLCAAEDLYELTGYRSMSPSAMKLVAVKMLRSDVSGDIKSDFRREIEILSTLHDPNLIQVLGVCTQEDPLCMVVEYMECGDLNQFLKDHVAESPSGKMQQKALNYGTLIYMASQIASGMKYLENLNYVHRDLATRNCLVGQNFTIKISDFGMSRRLYACDYYRIEGKAILPIRWMAWESILLGKFTTKSDVWSFAVTLWEVLTFGREQPFEQFSDDQVIENAGLCYQNDKKTIVLAQPANCPKEIYDLMRECWQKPEENRPNFREIHLFLQRKNLGYTFDR